MLIERGAEQLLAGAGTEVLRGERLLTGADGYASVSMHRAASVSVGANSAVPLDRYAPEELAVAQRPAHLSCKGLPLSSPSIASGSYRSSAPLSRARRPAGSLSRRVPAITAFQNALFSRPGMTSLSTCIEGSACSPKQGEQVRRVREART